MSLLVRRCFFCLPLAVLMALTGCATAPPVQDMSDARQAIAAAQEAGAEQYAADRLNEARRLLDTAERYLQQSNADGYWSARRAAINAKETAFEALLISRTAREQAQKGSVESPPR